ISSMIAPVISTGCEGSTCPIPARLRRSSGTTRTSWQRLPEDGWRKSNRQSAPISPARWRRCRRSWPNIRTISELARDSAPGRDRPLRRLLITGAAGRIGSIVRDPLAADWQVRCGVETAEQGAGLALPDVVPCDVTDPGQVDRAVAGCDA